MPTLLITGANRGLGLEFTRQYLEDGWTVIACCRTPHTASELTHLASQFPSLSIESLDVGEFPSIEFLSEKLQKKSVDLLINNAGIYSGSKIKVSATSGDESQEFDTLDPHAWERVLRVNTIAPIIVIKNFIGNLRVGSLKIVVNITSKMGSLTDMGSGALAYRSSKTALNAAMRVLAHDLSKENITIVNMHPGWVQTDMGGPSAHLTVADSIKHMRKSISKLKKENTGSFLNYDGKVLPW